MSNTHTHTHTHTHTREHAQGNAPIRTPFGNRWIASGRRAENCCGVMVRPPAGCPLPVATTAATHAQVTTRREDIRLRVCMANDGSKLCVQQCEAASLYEINRPTISR